MWVGGALELSGRLERDFPAPGIVILEECLSRKPSFSKAEVKMASSPELRYLGRFKKEELWAMGKSIKMRAMPRRLMEEQAHSTTISTS